MADTPNRGYNRPDQGSTDWHIPLNENFTAIDEDMAMALAVSSPVYTTDYSQTDKVLVAETGADIQAAIDALAAAGVSGVVQLLPGEYTPPTTTVTRSDGTTIEVGIDLHGQVTLQGAGAVNDRAPMGATAISAGNVPDRSPLVRWRPNSESPSGSGCQVSDIFFEGKRKDGVRAAGLFCPATVGNPRVLNSVVYEFYHSGVVFAGSQSGEVLKTRTDRCGVAANDTYGLDVGGGLPGGDFDRATIITSGFFGNGPTSDSSPVKIRDGSTLRFKPGGHRTGVRGHGPLSGPVIDIDGGDLEMNDAIVTTNITDPIGAGIRIRNGGSAELTNVKVEKADPNIALEGGSVHLRYCSVRNGKLFSTNGLGDGLWVADSGKAEEYTITHSSFVGNQGDGLDVARPGLGKHVDVTAQGNDGWGLNVDRLTATFRAILFDRDPDKPNGLGDVSDSTKVALGAAALD